MTSSLRKLRRHCTIKFKDILKFRNGHYWAAIVIVFAFCAFIFWVPADYMFRSVQRINTADKLPPADGLKLFAGSSECNITQQDIYDAPWPETPHTSPFCKDRATLLAALNEGSKSEPDVPFIGAGCTYRWFSTAEICMILERFSSVTITGDYLSQSIYTALTILLRGDLLHGGLSTSDMSPTDLSTCSCSKQFTDSICLSYTIKSFPLPSSETQNSMKGDPYSCNRIPHSYIPLTSTPASSSSISLFKEAAYNHPDPWKPSPLILSYAHGSSYSIPITASVLDEWTSLAINAQRNIPLLYLGPRASSPGSNEEVVRNYVREMENVLSARNWEVLGLWNCSFGVRLSEDGEDGSDGEALRLALVEAMMVVNWLAMLDTS